MDSFRQRLAIYRQHHQECFERYQNAQIELAQAEKLQVEKLLRQHAATGISRLRKTPRRKERRVKKVKKRHPWSGDDSDSDSDLKNSHPVISRKTKSQRASASKPKYTYDFSEEEDEGENASNSDIVSTEVDTAEKDQANESEIKEHDTDHDEDDFDADKESDSDSNQKTMPRPMAKKKKTAKIVSSKSAFSDKRDDSGKGQRTKKMASGSKDDDVRPAKIMANLVGRKAHDPSKDQNARDSQGRTKAVKCFAESDINWDMFD